MGSRKNVITGCGIHRHGRTRFIRRMCGRLLEALEPRQMLSLTTAEYASIRSTYTDFNLPADMAQINVIDIPTDQLSIANLKAAISAAGNSTLPDLVVLRTTDNQNTITYASAADLIKIALPSTSGALSIIGFGSQPLTIDGAGMGTVLTVGHMVVNLGGLTITRGESVSSGGGISQTSGTLHIQNATITGNAGYEGGGVYDQLGALSISGSTIAWNSAGYGGGVYHASGAFSATNVSINDNTADDGGGIYECKYPSYQSTSNLADVVVAGNLAQRHGAGLYLSSTTSTLTNVTIAANRGYDLNGGGVYIAKYDCSVTIRNSIIASNYYANGDLFVADTSATVTAANSIIADGTGQSAVLNGVNGNLVGTTSDPIAPVFVRAFGDPNDPTVERDLSLRADSPAVNGGDNAWLPAGLTTDIAGMPRIRGGTVDMGAYEFTPTTPNVSGFMVNDGSVQRSMVTKLVLTFNEPLNLADGALTLVKRNGSPVADVDLQVESPYGDQEIWWISFGGPAVVNQSLPDGAYKLVVYAAAVTDLQGNALTSDYRQNFFRLFGDSDGDRVVSRADLALMRTTLSTGPYCWWLDYDGSQNSYRDLLQLRLRLQRPLL